MENFIFCAVSFSNSECLVVTLYHPLFQFNSFIGNVKKWSNILDKPCGMTNFQYYV